MTNPDQIDLILQKKRRSYGQGWPPPYGQGFVIFLKMFVWSQIIVTYYLEEKNWSLEKDISNTMCTSSPLHLGAFGVKKKVLYL